MRLQTGNARLTAGLLACAICFGELVYAQVDVPPSSRTSPEAVSEHGIPVTDPLVIAKCGSCHPSDSHANLQRISWLRTTPEGWQDVVKSAIVVNGAKLTPVEARSVVKYLSTNHGLAPEESKPFMYYPERRVRDETELGDDNLRKACAKCHGLARTLSSRRSMDEWKRLSNVHTTRFMTIPNDEAVAFLSKAAPLHTPEWAAWSARMRTPDLTGRWLVSASVPGRGHYYGEMEVQPGGAEGEFRTRVKLRSVRDGSTIVRSGLGVVYAGYAWRGRSQGTIAPAPDQAADDLGKEAREVLWFSPDQAKAEGRWFWGQYQEFGFDVKLQRASSASALIGVEGAWLKTGSRGTEIRLIGENFSPQVVPGDLNLGPGVTVRRIVSHSAIEVLAEADVRADARPGKRDVVFGALTLPNAAAVYDRIDYISVLPESSLAAFGGAERPRGYQQFEAIGFQRGPDGKRHTADDVELGPIDVTWSLKIFYSAEGSRSDFVGAVGPSGLFTPAVSSPNNNFDVWVIATATGVKDESGKALVGKSYLVVTVPFYTFKGRRYVRDLERWVDDGPAPRSGGEKE